MSIKAHLELIKEFTIDNFKLKYKNAVVGYLWSVLAPLLMLITLYIVFSIIMRLDIPHYQLFLLLGVILWNYFSEATTTSMNSLYIYSSIIKKMNFPLYIFIVGSCLSSFLTLTINLLIFFLMMIIFKVSFHLTAFMFILYLTELLILTVGVSLILSSLHVKYRDIYHIWSILLLMGFWVTPIIYPETWIPLSFRRYCMLNPMARLIKESRNALIYNYIPSLKQLVITFIGTIIVFILGIITFKKRYKKFAEEL